MSRSNGSGMVDALIPSTHRAHGAEDDPRRTYRVELLEDFAKRSRLAHAQEAVDCSEKALSPRAVKAYDEGCIVGGRHGKYIACKPDQPEMTNLPFIAHGSRIIATASGTGKKRFFGTGMDQVRCMRLR